MKINKTAPKAASADLTSTVTLDHAEIERIVSEARTAQAETVFNLVFRPVARFVRAVAGSADVPSTVTIDHAEVERTVAAARAEQAEAIANLIFRPVARFVRAAAGRIAKRLQENRTMDELGRMSERELADMGIRRSDIPYLIRSSLWQARHEADVVAYTGVEIAPKTGAASNDQGRVAAA